MHDASGTGAPPVGDVGPFRQTFVEDFDVDAAAGGAFARTYENSWQPYDEGTGGCYWPGSQISARDGAMVVTLDGERGAAGAFGPPDVAWSRLGGKFTIRARATGGAGNGTAVMLWPSSDVWAEGEIDYPEGNFESSPQVHHHAMVVGQESTAESRDTGVSWNDWHSYSIEWIPGESVRYLLDDELVLRVTDHVPTAPHRYMFQVGDWGAPGTFEIDWVTTYDLIG